MQHPPLEKSYSAAVVLVVLALFPGLINTSAVSLLAPVIGADLHVPPAQIASLPLFSDAALAFGALLAADLVRRIDGRALFYAFVSASLLASLASALAPTFGVLLAAHIVHGLLGGLLFIVMLPPLLLTFGSAKIRTSATVLVPSLFGAATLGPAVAALASASGAWRELFFIEAGVASAVLIFGAFVLAPRPPQDAESPVDWYAHVVSALAALAIFAGAGQLAGHDWTYLPASLPVAAGVVLFVALVAGEYLRPNSLVPVRGLGKSIALVGIIATIAGSACYSATAEAFTLSLERLHGTSVAATGFAFWPQFIAAMIAGVVFGRLVPTKWVAVIGMSGLACSAVCALLALVVHPLDVRAVELLSPVAGLGAGLSVTPGLFLVSLTYERKLVARAIAMLNLLRLTGGFISAPGVEHTIGSRTRDRLVAELGSGGVNADRAAREFLATGSVMPGVPRAGLQTALAGGIADGLTIVLVISLISIALIVVILVRMHVPLRAPDMQRFDKGEPALAPG